MSELEASSRLARIGMRPGDIISGVNRQRVVNLESFREHMEEAGSTVLFQIRRNGEAYIVRVD